MIAFIITLSITIVIIWCIVAYLTLRNSPTVKEDMFYLKIKAFLILNYLLDNAYQLKVKTVHTLKSKYTWLIKRFKG